MRFDFENPTWCTQNFDTLGNDGFRWLIVSLWPCPSEDGYVRFELFRQAENGDGWDKIAEDYFTGDEDANTEKWLEEYRRALNDFADRNDPDTPDPDLPQETENEI
jgi:hypothetical protein